MAELGLPLTVRLYKFQVIRSLANLPVLFALMRVAQSLLLNPHVHIEPYVSGWPSSFGTFACHLFR
jgi:hypothetical protein